MIVIDRYIRNSDGDDDMDLKDLEIFYTVARTGSMTRAAKELGFVQSHITGRIRLLEDEFQQSLFERLKTGVVLTTEGKKLYPHAESLLVQWHETHNVFLEQGELTGALHIGCLETTAALYTAGWIADFHKKNPKVEITLQTGTTRELVQLVLDRTSDIALVAGSVEHAALDSKELVTEELAIITSIDRTLDSMLTQNPIIIAFREGCTYRQILERWLENRGFPVFRVMESASIDTILQLTAGGLGISIMPKTLLSDSRWKEQLAMYPIEQSNATVQTYAVWRRKQHVPRTISAFLEHLTCDKL